MAIKTAARLVVTDTSNGESFEYELVSPESRIGRALQLNDIVLNQAQVSREHALIRSEGETYRLIDLDSSNGTKINGQRIKEHLLNDGDVFTIGKFQLVFHKEPPEIRLHYKEIDTTRTVLFRPSDQLVPAVPQTLEQSAVYGAGSGEQILQENLTALRKKAETLSRLYELNRLLASVFSLDDIFEKVSEMLFRLTPAERFVVLLGEESEIDSLSNILVRIRPGTAESERDMPISRTVVKRVVSEKLSLLSLDALHDERLLSAESIVAQRIASILCAPLLQRGNLLGVIYTDSRRRSRIFNADDLELLNALCAQASIAIDNARTHEKLLREAVARAAYARFMPQHVVDEILAHPDTLTLGGSNRQIAVLFSDIRGFTSLSEKLPPETVVQVLNEYFSEMTPILFEHQGLLDKYMGDNVMALFGVPYERQDAAANAVKTAVAMQKRLRDLSGHLKEKAQAEISVGIGINFGTGTVGYIGSKERTDYTAVGDVVNLAARLEKQAKAGQILISESVRQALDDAFEVRPVGLISVKGRTEAVQVYEVKW
ncbi:MAG: adenylate/guanylate cyclase domain-containing protein [Acidobacteriota bacterium]